MTSEFRNEATEDEEADDEPPERDGKEVVDAGERVKSDEDATLGARSEDEEEEGIGAVR